MTRLAPLLVLLIAPSLWAQSSIATIRGNNDRDYAGESVLAPGDLNGDGVDDLIYGESGFDGSAGSLTGRVTAISGATGGVLWRTEGSNANDWLGADLAVLGDLDGDGAAEWLAGAPYGGPNGPNSGIAVVGDGRTGAIIRTHIGDADASGDGFGDSLGYRLSGVPDVDGDAVPDYLIGAPGDLFAGGFCNTQDQTGSVQLRCGATGALMATFAGTPNCGAAGAALAGIDDLNGDGRGEILLGFPESTLTGGRIEVRDGATGALLRTHPGTSQGDFFGIHVGAVGDIDRDGIGDYAGGADMFDVGSGVFASGMVRIFSGATGTEIVRLRGRQTSDFHGRSFGPLGDWDGDGADDIYVGAPGDEGEGIGTGRITIYSGRTALAIDTIAGRPGDFLGFSERVAPTADVTGDGRPEIAIGAWTDDRRGTDRGVVRWLAQGPRSHLVDPSLLSLTQPDPLELTIDAGPGAAHATYVIVGSFSGEGTTPIGRVTLPLVVDLWTTRTADPLRTPFVDGFGLLDAAGTATATFTLPPGLPATLDGLTQTSAAVVLLANGTLLASNPARVVLTAR